MNSQGLNSSTLDGGKTPSWVISAAVLALASLSSTAEATRVLQGRVNSQAAATVTLTQLFTIAGRASNSVDTTSSVTPNVILAAESVTSASAFGNAAVVRYVNSDASADGTATAVALVSDALGQSVALAVSTSEVVPHIVHPGVVNSFGYAIASEATGVVYRMPVSKTSAYSSGYAEASYQASGNSYRELDGFVNAQATSAAYIRNDYTTTIATLGSFEFSRALARSTSFIKYSGQVSAWSNGSGLAKATTTRTGSGMSVAESIANASGIRIAKTQTTGLAVSTALPVKAKVDYKAHASKSAGVALVSGLGIVTRYARAKGQATVLPNDPVIANHYFGSAEVLGTSNVSFADAEVVLGSYITGLASASGAAQTAAHHKAYVNGVGGVTSISTPADFYSIELSATASSTGLCFASLDYWGFVLQNAQVTSYVVASTNIDVRAPSSRTMVVPFDTRSMLVSGESTTMTVGG